MTLPAGTLLGNYELLGPLGVGGMGEVYRALDRKLGREVAIKVLPPAFAEDPGRIARFEREARLLASVNHPAIAAIYGAEESGAVRYLVLELVPGETLAERLTTGPLPIGEALEIGRQVADGLEAAHERGIVHRDLKPANVKVTPEGKVKILDLGLAKALDIKAEEENISRSPTAALDQTRPGMILGTAEFMSPEQARGKALDKRTDIWSFGCILYEMLSGRRAFTGETLPDVLTAILSSEPDWTALPRQTPVRVRETLGRCLQKDPNKRLRDMGDARHALEDALAELEGRSAPSLPPIAAPRPARRLFPAVLAAGAIAVAAAAVLLLRATEGRIPNEKYLAVLPFKDLSGLRGGQLAADALVETVSVRLGRLSDIQVVTPTAAVAAADRQSDPFQAARELGANLILRGSVQRSGDQVRIAYSVWNAQKRVQIAGDTLDGSALDVFALQDRLAERVTDLLGLQARPQTTPAPSGLNAGEQDRYLQAIGYLQRYDKPGNTDQAIRLLEELASQRPSAALVLAALGRAYLYKYGDTREQNWVGLAEAACDRAVRLDPRLPEAHVTVGRLKTLTGRAADAVEAFRRALAIQPNDYPAILGLAAALEEAGDSAQAEQTYRRAIALQPDHWAGHNELAAFFVRRGRYSEAVKTLERVTTLTPDNPVAFSNLGATLALEGDFEAALPAYRRSLELAPTDVAHSNLGTTQFYLGRYSEAASSFKAAVGLTPGHFQLWANLGDAYRWAPGMKSQADPAYERAIGLARGELRVNPANALAHSYLALCLAKTGRAAEAEEHARRSLALEPSNPELLYNAAVVASVGQHTAEAVKRLRRALQSGYPAAIVRRDPELSPLHKESSFREILQSGA